MHIPEGDLCSRKGALTGGYIDNGRSRLGARAELKEREEKLNELEEEERDKQRKASTVDQHVSAIMGEIQRLEAKRANLEHVLQRADDDISSLKSRIDVKNKQIEQTENEIIPPLETEIMSLDGQASRLREEMGSELSASLTDEERETLNHLKSQQAELEGDLEKAQSTLEEISVEHQRLQSMLENNLRKRRQELIDESAGESGRRSRGGKKSTAASQAQRKEDLQQRQRELSDAARAAEEVEERLTE